MVVRDQLIDVALGLSLTVSRFFSEGKTFKFVDYNGNPRTEDHYFNLTQAEVTELERQTARFQES